MIWIFNLERASAGLCDNYDDVFHYITELEKLNQSDNLKIPANALGLASFDTEADKKQWCISFCKNHNYVMVETPSKPHNSRPTHWNSQFQSPYFEDQLELAN